MQMAKSMRLKNWLSATSLALALVVAGCTPPESNPRLRDEADSLIVVALSSRLDSMQAALEAVASEQAMLTERMAGIRDTLEVLARKLRQDKAPDVGGEARGAPIWRDNKAREVGK